MPCRGQALCYNRGMRLKIILNPAAENGVAGKKCWPKVKAFLEQKGVEYSMDQTLAPGDGTIQTSRALKEGYDTIVSMGGDGTASEVINALVGSDVNFGIIPCGVGNDFVKVIGLSRKNIIDSVETILRGYTRKIDLGSVNGRYFFNMIGIGFDGEVAEKKARSYRFIKGFWAYYAQVIPLLFMYRPKPVHIEMNGVTMDTTILFLTVGNGRYSGGGFKLTPLSEIDDGLFDVCLVHYPGLFNLFRHVNKVPKGKHIKLPFVFYLRTDRIKITSEVMLPAHIDGEVARSREFDIRMIPRSLNVIVKR